MATTSKFDQNLIKQYLQAHDLKYLVDSDGDFLAQFSYDDKWGCSLRVYFILGGQAKDIYVIRVYSDKRIPRSSWAKAYEVCNTWHKERRWPKAFLHVENPGDESGSIIVEQHIDLEKGIHQELFDDYTTTIVLGAFQFWEWAHQEQGL